MAPSGGKRAAADALLDGEDDAPRRPGRPAAAAPRGSDEEMEEEDEEEEDEDEDESEEEGEEEEGLDAMCDVCGSTYGACVMLLCDNNEVASVRCPYGRHYHCCLSKRMRLSDLRAEQAFYCSTCVRAGYKLPDPPTPEQGTEAGASSAEEEGDSGDDDEEDRDYRAGEEAEDDDVVVVDEEGEEEEGEEGQRRPGGRGEPQRAPAKPAAARAMAAAAGGAAAGGRGGGGRGRGRGRGRAPPPPVPRDPLARHEARVREKERAARGVEAARAGHTGRALGTAPADLIAGASPAGGRGQPSGGRGGRGGRGEEALPPAARRNNLAPGRGAGRFSGAASDVVLWSGHLELRLARGPKAKPADKEPLAVVSASIQSLEQRDGRPVTAEQVAALRRVPRGARLVAYVSPAMALGSDFLVALSKSLEPSLKVNFPTQQAERALEKVGCKSRTHWAAVPIGTPAPLLFVVLQHDCGLKHCAPVDAVTARYMYTSLASFEPALAPPGRQQEEEEDEEEEEEQQQQQQQQQRPAGAGRLRSAPQQRRTAEPADEEPPGSGAASGSTLPVGPVEALGAASGSTEEVEFCDAAADSGGGSGGAEARAGQAGAEVIEIDDDEEQEQEEEEEGGAGTSGHGGAGGGGMLPRSERAASGTGAADQIGALLAAVSRRTGQEQQQQQQQRRQTAEQADGSGGATPGAAIGAAYAREVDASAVAQLLREDEEAAGCLVMGRLMPDLQALLAGGSPNGGAASGWAPFRVALLGFEEAGPLGTRTIAMQRAVQECRRLRATVFKDLASLAAAVRGAPNQGPPVIVVPRHAGPAKLAAALAEGAGGSGGAVPWWRVLTTLLPGVLVFYEDVGEGLLTACRLWLADGRGPPARDPAAWAAALRPLQLHPCGVAVVGGDLLRYAPPEQVERLLALLAKGRARSGAPPASWPLALRDRDLAYLAGWAAGVANVLRDTRHADTVLRLDDLLAEADRFWGGVTGPGGDEPRAPANGAAGAAAGASAAAWRAHLGLEGSEPDVVRDAAALAWLRRGALRLVIVLVPDARHAEGGGGQRGRPVVSHEHARSSLRVLQDASQRVGGSVLAGTVSDVVELLQRVVEAE
ncbi:hypothetical protein Rsub_05021 [Raphidocelis subcapitata]|uniref:PHD-type domain-containing protein n=1 Tax=Raphidocelis subcapitata TaxID=307507 RepID=A0A2V0P155_9CHLO|nr:hypothetical protein Rsub_05021 [Raphidocelis subcapitata]|eukprot:GBF92652.1 hypothetical protein Rsub_05021 [Raphidocelis subcapitata]